jgi:hypothetical protein
VSRVEHTHLGLLLDKSVDLASEQHHGAVVEVAKRVGLLTKDLYGLLIGHHVEPPAVDFVDVPRDIVRLIVRSL